MLRAFDAAGRRAVAWPLVILGLILTQMAVALIRAGAWIAGINTEDTSRGG